MEQTQSEKEVDQAFEPIQVGGESEGEEGRSKISKPRRQHERREEAKKERKETERAMTKSKWPKAKDPKGGLTAAGRRAFAKRDSSHLKPGVKTSGADMTPQEMRRKGSWATRFYGREKLSPLVDKNGKPTRFALTAAAWGEPVPKTVAAARKIAKKGEQLLKRYERTKTKLKNTTR